MGYQEDFYVAQVGPVLAADYREAQRQVGDDDGWVIWPARIQADMDAGLTGEAALIKHRQVWRAALGLGLVVLPVAHATPRVRRAGRWLVSDAGRFTWRMVSAFRLCHMIANGEEIRPFLDWCQTSHVDLRVFTMARNLFALPPAQGREVLPIVLALAADYGRYVEVVALADTFAYPQMDVGHHVAEVGAICASFENTFLEGCNEPLQHWQSFSPSALDDFLADIPAAVPRTLGGPDGDGDESTAYIVPQSDYGVSHTARSGSGWRRVRHIREQQVIADSLGIYVVDDEPENAKNLTSAQLFAAGAIAAICGLGQTHHAEWGKVCRLPTQDEHEQFTARRRGWEMIPPSFHGKFSNYGWRTPLPEHPFAHAFLRDGSAGDSRVYAGVTDQEAYVVMVYADTPVFRDGWHGECVADVGEASVWHCLRS